VKKVQVTIPIPIQVLKVILTVKTVLLAHATKDPSMAAKKVERNIRKSQRL
jgi:hypothetical protein